jgi:hypothetical protein
LGLLEIGVARDKVVFGAGELTGNFLGNSASERLKLSLVSSDIWV